MSALKIKLFIEKKLEGKPLTSNPILPSNAPTCSPWQGSAPSVVLTLSFQPPPPPEQSNATHRHVLLPRFHNTVHARPGCRVTPSPSPFQVQFLPQGRLWKQRSRFTDLFFSLIHLIRRK